MALKSKQPEVAEVLLQSLANLNICDSDGKTPLHFACENNQIEAAKMLLQEGADYFFM